MPNTRTWVGDENSDFEEALNWSDNTAPIAGDSIIFDNTSDGNSNDLCVIDDFSTPSYLNITIASNYIGKLQTNNTVVINIAGALTINRADCLKFAGSNTVNFTGNPASVGIDTYDGAGTAYTKALVSFGADASVWNEGRDNTAFIFPSHSFSMVDGVYPKFTFTGTLKAKKIYSDASRTEFNNYGSVDIGDMDANDVSSSSYDIYDYSKEFLFEGTLTAIGEFFRFGHTTARFKTFKTSSYGGIKFPATGNITTEIGNSTTRNFYAQYHKLVIETNDVIDNYWVIPAGLTIECNELVIKDGGRIYGDVGTDAKAATIKCVKRPTIRGDWNFRQIADGVYETIGAISNTPVYHGGTGRQTLTKNALLYGNGMESVNLLGIGQPNKYLKVNSGATGYEWADASGGSSANDSTITLTAGTGLSNGGNFTTNQNTNETITFNVSGLTVSELAADSLQISSENFADNDTSLMTSAAIKDEIETGIHTLTNKTINADGTGNSITNIDTENFTSAFQSTYAYNSLHPIFFERGGINTGAVDFRAPTTTTSSANPNGFPMPFAGHVIAASFIFSGGTITNNSSNNNVIRIRKNGGSSGSDIFDTNFVTHTDQTYWRNTNGTNYTLVFNLSPKFAFAAGDVIQVKRQSGNTNLYNGQAILWVQFT